MTFKDSKDEKVRMTDGRAGKDRNEVVKSAKPLKKQKTDGSIDRSLRSLVQEAAAFVKGTVLQRGVASAEDNNRTEENKRSRNWLPRSLDQ